MCDGGNIGDFEGKCPPGLESGTIIRMQAGAVCNPYSLHFEFR